MGRFGTMVVALQMLWSVCPNLVPTWVAKFGNPEIHRDAKSWGSLWSLFSSALAALGRSWDALGGSWGALGLFLGALGSLSGCSWAALGC